MTKEQLIDHINHGREIEFRYKRKMHSITHGIIDGKHVISFCEFYQDTTEVESAIDLLNIKVNGISVIEMIESISDEEIWIY